MFNYLVVTPNQETNPKGIGTILFCANASPSMAIIADVGTRRNSKVHINHFQC